MANLKKLTCGSQEKSPFFRVNRALMAIQKVCLTGGSVGVAMLLDMNLTETTL